MKKGLINNYIEILLKHTDLNKSEVSYKLYTIYDFLKSTQIENKKIIVVLNNIFYYLEGLLSLKPNNIHICIKNLKDIKYNWNFDLTNELKKIDNYNCNFKQQLFELKPSQLLLTVFH